MTTQKTFKRRVRARMTKTGESYTAARRQLIANGDQPDPGTPTFETVVADERMIEATGQQPRRVVRSILDAWGGPEPHPHRHRPLRSSRSTPCRAGGRRRITVSYQRARGLRAVGQIKDGWTVNASKTIDVPVDELFDALEDLDVRKQWLPDAELAPRTVTRPKSARYDWEDGSTRVVVAWEAKDEKKSTIYISHERLPDADTAEAMKGYWRAALVDLKAMMESEGSTR